MPLARFVEFLKVPEVLERDRDAVRFAIVVARAPGGVVLVFNRYREVWELPGGLWDPGETLRECAARELLEEANCAAGPLRWHGLVEVNDGRSHRGAVFSCALAGDPAPFTSEETAGITLWSPSRAPRPLGEVDAEMLRRLGAPPAEPSA
jgi:8-oxo-dGTP diphosphatase